jgi:hypothetical protein
MSISRRSVKISTALLGTAMLAIVGGAALAQADEIDDNEVEVTVQIAEIGQPGVLALSVAGTATTLTENGSDGLVRQFTGTLPTVTVTDTRTPDEIPDGAYWYVLGTASDFTGTAGQPDIGAEYLGWTPRLIDGGESGLVAEGDPVGSAVDGGPDDVGLVDQELLAITVDSHSVATEGSWTVTADLALRTPATVAPGSYASTVTLSLFE